MNRQAVVTGHSCPLPSTPSLHLCPFPAEDHSHPNWCSGKESRGQSRPEGRLLPEGSTQRLPARTPLTFTHHASGELCLGSPCSSGRSSSLSFTKSGALQTTRQAEWKRAALRGTGSYRVRKPDPNGYSVLMHRPIKTHSQNSVSDPG